MKSDMFDANSKYIQASHDQVKKFLITYKIVNKNIGQRDDLKSF